MDVQLRRGILEASVLTVLMRGESYGYQLVRDVSEIIPISESTLYPILKRLESGGQLDVYSIEHNGRLRKYYRITDAGRRRISEFMDEWKELMQVYTAIKREMEENDHD